MSGQVSFANVNDSLVKSPLRDVNEDLSARHVEAFDCLNFTPARIEDRSVRFDIITEIFLEASMRKIGSLSHLVLDIL